MTEVSADPERLRRDSSEASPGPWEYEPDREGSSMGWIGHEVPAGHSTVFRSIFKVEGDSAQQAINAEFAVACVNYVRAALLASPVSTATGDVEFTPSDNSAVTPDESADWRTVAAEIEAEFPADMGIGMSQKCIQNSDNIRRHPTQRAQDAEIGNWSATGDVVERAILDAKDEDGDEVLKHGNWMSREAQAKHLARAIIAALQAQSVSTTTGDGLPAWYDFRDPALIDPSFAAQPVSTVIDEDAVEIEKLKTHYQSKLAERYKRERDEARAALAALPGGKP